MENSSQEMDIVWQRIPKRHFIHKLEVGQYMLSKRPSSEIAAGKPEETVQEMAALLNRSIDKLLYQPGGGDHGALDWIWKRLDKKIIKEFDMYMKVNDQSELKDLPGNVCVLDVSEAVGLMYSKVVQVQDDPEPAPPVVTDNMAVVADPQPDPGLEKDGEANSQPEPEVNADPGSEQDGEPGPEANVDQGLEQDGNAVPKPNPEVNEVPGLEQVEGANPQPEANEDDDLELVWEGESQRVPHPDEFPPLIPGLQAAPAVWRNSIGVQTEENPQSRTSQVPITAPQERVLFSADKITMPRLEDMIEPEAMAVYWQKYNESKKSTADTGNPNQPLKPILKRKLRETAQPKKNVRFDVTVEENERAKKKYKLDVEWVRTRSQTNKRDEMRELYWKSFGP